MTTPVPEAGNSPVGVRRAFLGALLINAPFLAFLLYYWRGAEVRFFTYWLPLLHDFPKGWPLDLALVSLAILACVAVRGWPTVRRGLLVVCVSLAVFVPPRPTTLASPQRTLWWISGIS